MSFRTLCDALALATTIFAVLAIVLGEVLFTVLFVAWAILFSVRLSIQQADDRQERVADAPSQAEVERLRAETERLRPALYAAQRELSHWLDHRKGRAMSPQSEKGEEVVRMAYDALNPPAEPEAPDA